MEEGIRAAEQSKTMKRLLLILNCLLLSVGTSGGPLIMRLYFLHGGKRVWFSAFLETAGFPIISIPLAICYIHRRRRRHSQQKSQIVFMKPRLFAASAITGVLTGLDDYLYAFGVARLPVSTSSLIIATQLAFTAIFAFVLVRQKFTAFSVNAVVLLTVGAGVLALRSSGDRPAGESNKQYILGFVTTLGAAALYGLILPSVELAYRKCKQSVTYTLVMEFQFVMSLFATLFCTLGMLINNDFKAIGREAREFGLGETKYYVVVVLNGIMWQGFFMGAVGVIFCASSLLSGIIIAALLPVTEVLGVIFYKESFRAEKGIALVLSLWGFVSYFYGEFKDTQKKRQPPTPHTQVPPTVTNP